MIARLRERLLEPEAFRLRVAVLMVFVSLAGAYIAHVATERGSDVAALEGIAAQQSAEEQEVEQQIDGIVAQDLRLTARLDEPFHAFREAVSQAATVRATDPTLAGQYDLQAQAQYDRLRALYPFFRAAAPDLSGESATYDADAARNSMRAEDWRLFRASSALTREQASALGGTTSAIVLVVVLLVASLFLLTLAHLSGGRRGLALAALGGLTALVAMAWFTAVAADSAIPLLVAGVLGLVVAVVIGRIARQRRWLQGVEQIEAVPGIVGVPTSPPSTAAADPKEAPTTRFTRSVAIAIALLTLTGAWVGYVQGGAAGRSDAAAWDARDLGVQAIGALRAAEEQTTVAIETYQVALGQRVEAWNARQASAYAISTSDFALGTRLAEDADRWDSQAALTEARSGIADQLGSTGVSDDLALIKLRAAIWQSGARLSALQDAGNDTSRIWGDRAAIYTTVLAWLAVAAYLLGLSLVFREDRVRLLLASVGVFMVLAGAVQAGAVWLQPDTISTERATAAADAYADGFVALMRNEPKTARAKFTDAIALRDDFGLARRERAQAILQSGSVQSGIQSVFTPESIGLAIDDLESARERGVATAGVLLNLGAMEFHRAIETGDPAIMQRSADQSRLGLDLGEAFGRTYGVPHVNEVIGESNLGLAQTATGQLAEADTTYRQMAADTKKLPSQLPPYLVAATLTTLEILTKAHEPTPADVLARMKELVVAETYGAATDSPARLTAARAEIFPSILQWRATIPGFDPARDKLVTQWYRHDDTADRWYVLPLVSGPVTLDAIGFGGQFHHDADPDTYWGNSDGLTRDVPPTCTIPGTYRVELYLNGRLDATQTADASTHTYSPHLARDVGFAMCRPPEFVPAGVQPGLSSGAADVVGSRGITVFRVHQPYTPDGPDARLTALEREIRGGTVGLPADLGLGTELDPLSQATVFGRRDGVWRQYDYPGGVAKAAAVWTGDGSLTVLVTCIYGPSDWIDSGEAEALLLSLTER